MTPFLLFKLVELAVSLSGSGRRWRSTSLALLPPADAILHSIPAVLVLHPIPFPTTGTDFACWEERFRLQVAN